MSLAAGDHCCSRQWPAPPGLSSISQQCCWVKEQEQCSPGFGDGGVAGSLLPSPWQLSGGSSHAGSILLTPMVTAATSRLCEEMESSCSGHVSDEKAPAVACQHLSCSPRGSGSHWEDRGAGSPWAPNWSGTRSEPSHSCAGNSRGERGVSISSLGLYALLVLFSAALFGRRSRRGLQTMAAHIFQLLDT